MKKIVLSLLVIVAFVIASCEKDIFLKTNSENLITENKSKSLVPPYRETDYGEYQPDHPNGPYPDISCNFMGWDCLPMVLVKGTAAGFYQGDDYGSYLEAADLLDGYIQEGNTEEFFINYPEKVTLLMPELYEGTEKTELVLADLKDGTTTVMKHIKTLESEQNVFLYTIVYKESGEPVSY